MHSNTRAGMIDAPVLPEGEEDGADDDIGGGFGGIGDIIVLSLLLSSAGCFLVRSSCIVFSPLHFRLGFLYS